jgi:tRNA pseudouridine55 synthase
MNGILVIDKPSGWTSHDVVGRVRVLFREKRIGHTGTLDPLATGVLVLCVGKATRLARYFESADKQYDAVMRLGVTTDTQDAEGRVTETREYAPPSEEAVTATLERFRGVITQRPPAFSAVKVSGVPSYKLARRGKAEPLKERQVTIHDIALLEYRDPLVSIRVACSKGTYVRTLCDDVGRALGTGAHLAALRRTRAGNFGIEQAWTLDRLQELVSEGEADQALIPLEQALAGFPAVTVGAPESVRIVHGNPVSLGDRPAVQTGLPVVVYDEAGRLLAVARVRDGLVCPEVVTA